MANLPLSFISFGFLFVFIILHIDFCVLNWESRDEEEGKKKNVGTRVLWSLYMEEKTMRAKGWVYILLPKTI